MTQHLVSAIKNVIKTLRTLSWYNKLSTNPWPILFCSHMQYVPPNTASEKKTKPSDHQAWHHTCTSLTFASRDPRLSTGLLWCSAHAPTWLPRGRLWKYSVLSFSVTCQQNCVTATAVGQQSTGAYDIIHMSVPSRRRTPPGEGTQT